MKFVLRMAEGRDEPTVDDEIVPYRFEPDGQWSSSDSSDGSDSDCSDEQASFTERLGNTLWCSCAKCHTMPRAIECLCCCEIEEVAEQLEDEERLEGEDNTCITNLEQFKTVCLDKDVLYTALVTMLTVRGEHFEQLIGKY